MPPGVSWVHSDTLGLARFSSGELMIAEATREYPYVTHLFALLLNGRCIWGSLIPASTAHQSA